MVSQVRSRPVQLDDHATGRYYDFVVAYLYEIVVRTETSPDSEEKPCRP
jgi:hypothetical protein